MTNKDIEYYMQLNFKMVVLLDHEGIYTAYFPDLPGCITCGDTPDELFKNAEDAKRCWIKGCIEDNAFIPEPSEPLYSFGSIKKENSYH